MVLVRSGLVLMVSARQLVGTLLGSASRSELLLVPEFARHVARLFVHLALLLNASPSVMLPFPVWTGAMVLPLTNPMMAGLISALVTCRRAVVQEVATVLLSDVLMLSVVNMEMSILLWTLIQALSRLTHDAETLPSPVSRTRGCVTCLVSLARRARATGFPPLCCPRWSIRHTVRDRCSPDVGGTCIKDNHTMARHCP